MAMNINLPSTGGGISDIFNGRAGSGWQQLETGYTGYNNLILVSETKNYIFSGAPQIAYCIIAYDLNLYEVLLAGSNVIYYNTITDTNIVVRYYTDSGIIEYYSMYMTDNVRYFLFNK